MPDLHRVPPARVQRRHAMSVNTPAYRAMTSRLKVDRFHFLLMCSGVTWLALMGLLIWMHAHHSTQPPIYDALTYYAKGKTVWEAIATGSPFDTLDVQPSFRPPATVLMSYPFGFDGDFRGFYFRSVFFPVALVLAAMGLLGNGGTRVDRAFHLLTACFLSTLSLFFYFEPYADGPPLVSYWGLVDGFLTGLAALGAACVVRSVRARSIPWAIVAILVGTAMILVKPSGALLAALLGTALTVGWLFDVRDGLSAKGTRARVLKRFAILVTIEAVLFGGTLLACLQSKYLGAANMAYGKAALEVMRTELNLDVPGVMSIVQGGLGPFVAIWLLAVTALLAYRFNNGNVRGALGAGDRLMVTIAGVIVLVGMWFWLVGSGGQTQIRYFTPFLYLAIGLVVRPLLRLIGKTRPIQIFLACLMGLGIANTLLILAFPHPSLRWQLASGVNVMAGSTSEALNQATRIVEVARLTREPVTVYSMAFNIADAMFESTFHLALLDNEKLGLQIRRPVDWQRPSTYRVEEILEADYLLYDPRQAEITEPGPAEDFTQEQGVFHSWVARLSDADGVTVESRAPGAVLLRVVARNKLRASLDRLVAARQWREVFVQANASDWWSEHDVASALHRVGVAVENVSFGGILKLRAAMLVPLSDKEFELRSWMSPLIPSDKTRWIMLVHAIDAEGTILSNFDIALPRFDSVESVDSFRYVHKVIAVPIRTSRVAIGIYAGKTILQADRGKRDWNDRRVLINLPSTDHDSAFLSRTNQSQ